MIKLFLLFFVVCQLTALGQELKRKKKGEETFYVLKSDASILHGEYIKKGSTGILVKGHYEMNKKAGIWEFYGFNGSIEQRYDYSNKLLLLNESSMSESIQHGIIKDGVPTNMSPDRGPILIGGTSMYFRHVMENIRYPSKAKINGTQGRVFVSGIITAEGILKDIKVHQGLGDGCDEEALRVINLFEGEWIPGTSNGEKVDVRVVFSLAFKLG